MGLVDDNCGGHTPSVLGDNLIPATAALVVVRHQFCCQGGEEKKRRCSDASGRTETIRWRGRRTSCGPAPCDDRD